MTMAMLIVMATVKMVINYYMELEQSLVII